MEEAIRELFNQTTHVFVERSAIHDLCSKQIGKFIAKKRWIQPTDSVMVIVGKKWHCRTLDVESDPSPSRSTRKLRSLHVWELTRLTR